MFIYVKLSVNCESYHLLEEYIRYLERICIVDEPQNLLEAYDDLKCGLLSLWYKRLESNIHIETPIQNFTITMLSVQSSILGMEFSLTLRR